MPIFEKKRVAENCYQALQVFPGSSMEEIRKSYRRLAMKFHPDKNPGNEMAAKRFLAIREAYDLLSDPQRRTEYDRQHGYTFSRNAPAPTPDMILAEAATLRKYVQSLNLHSLDHAALSYHLRKLLSPQRAAILENYPDELLLIKLRDEMILASRPLKYSLLPEAMASLEELLLNHAQVKEVLNHYLLERKQANRIEQLVPWLVLLITLILCWLIFQTG